MDCHSGSGLESQVYSFSNSNNHWKELSEKSARLAVTRKERESQTNNRNHNFQIATEPQTAISTSTRNKKPPKPQKSAKLYPNKLKRHETEDRLFSLSQIGKNASPVLPNPKLSKSVLSSSTLAQENSVILQELNLDGRNLEFDNRG